MTLDPAHKFWKTLSLIIAITLVSSLYATSPSDYKPMIEGVKSFYFCGGFIPLFLRMIQKKSPAIINTILKKNPIVLVRQALDYVMHQPVNIDKIAACGLFSSKKIIGETINIVNFLCFYGLFSVNIINGLFGVNIINGMDFVSGSETVSSTPMSIPASFEMSTAVATLPWGHGQCMNA